MKAAVVSKALSGAPGLQEEILHTGQHFDANMSEIFFDEMGIPAPTHRLDIGGGTHGENTGRMIEAVERVLIGTRPDLVMVYGDTDSTLAGAIAASKLGIRIAHVEAGLRSFNRAMPEEINRVLTDHVSDLLFVPSAVAVRNLADEGVTGDKVRVVGDVMFDAVRLFTDIARRRSSILAQLGLSAGEFILVTLHRKENTDDRQRLSAILAGLSTSEEAVVLPLHPRTRKRIAEFEIRVPPNLKIIDPVGYLDMLLLEANANLIATDSGGVQKEAYFNGVPCITMRDETEWTELLEIGANRLVGANADAIAAAIRTRPAMPEVTDIYGSGDASIRIAQALAGV
ncbi:MAG: UDP-GlcNAc3NAcA epimerase [Bradyrhizobium sp.]|nr:UDP-GlcNAc3NAcA epimerase [Bradyrhizobium sp.]